MKTDSYNLRQGTVMDKWLVRGVLIMVFGAIIAGCGVTPANYAPGANRVKVTKNSADVTGCAAVGNVRSEENTAIEWQNVEMQNQAVGLGANVIFVGTQGMGVAYRCGTVSTPLQQPAS